MRPILFNSRPLWNLRPLPLEKGVQQLIYRSTALGRFISRFTEQLKPFFTTLKGAKQTGWDKECDQALIAIKQYLTEPPILASSETGETLYLYIVVYDVSVSATLFKEDEHEQQKPIFFISKSLSEAKTQYTCLEQAALTLLPGAPYYCTHQPSYEKHYT